MLIHIAPQGSPEWVELLRTAFRLDAAYVAAKRDMHAGCTL